MISLNKAMLIGNVTRDPELRTTPTGQNVTNFSIATNRRWRTPDGQTQEDTQFHDIVAWGKLAEIITQILKKGSRVFVEGRLQTRSWEAPDGAKMRRTEVVMENFVSLTPRGAGVTYATPMPTDDLPKSIPSTSEPDAKPVINDKTLGNLPSEDEINLDDIPF